MKKVFKKGFTLIELLVVISIIGILSAIVVANLNKARQRGKESRAISELTRVASAVETYFVDNKEYPTSMNQLIPNYLQSAPSGDFYKTGYDIVYKQGNFSYGTSSTSTHKVWRVSLNEPSVGATVTMPVYIYCIKDTGLASSSSIPCGIVTDINITKPNAYKQVATNIYKRVIP